jgi:Lrp/AsnC family transcriptional regulator, regulator for asnA, asnC and gidA
VAIDELDEKLLDLLRANAREAYVDLAKKLGTSEGTVRARLKRLTDTGLIRRFTIRTAGSNIKTLIEIKVETNVHTADISSKIAAWKGVELVYEISGEHDILVVAEAQNTSELNEIIERIREFPQVQATRSRLILREV